ncbi:MAG: hypothetical protein GX629_04270, partial [Phycisphaerae bacterium]|nr:hypothetical protein [Phycisphaerae bacterium]
EINEGYVLKKKDGKYPLEDLLNSVMAGLIQKAGERYVEKIIRQQREKERKEREAIELERRQREEEIRRQEEERKRKEQERVDTLFKEANLYDSCLKIRAYVQAVQNAAIEKDGQIQEGSPLAEWIEWASQLAYFNDPVGKRIERHQNHPESSSNAIS